MRRKEIRIRRMLMLGGFVATAALTACNGWPRAIPYNEARTKPEKYPTYAASPIQAETIAFEGKRWLVMPGAEELRGAQLQSVGSAGNLPIYAAKGNEAPFQLLYAPAGGTKWHRVLPID